MVWKAITLLTNDNGRGEILSPKEDYRAGEVMVMRSMNNIQKPTPSPGFPPGALRKGARVVVTWK
jgi:hypothetical protein